VRIDDFVNGLETGWVGDPQVAMHPTDRRFSDLPRQTGGMATENKLALLNLAARCMEPGEVYLEIGTFVGTSIIGAALDNDDREFVTIDNFSMFGGPRDLCLANVGTFCPRGNVSVVEADAWEALGSGVTGGSRVGASFDDGGHSFDDQFKAFELVEPLFADRAVIIVDDTARRSISAANRACTRGRPDDTLLRRSTSPYPGDPLWWNGIEVFAFERSPRSRPTRRSWYFQSVKWAFATNHRRRVLGAPPLAPRRHAPRRGGRLSARAGSSR